MQFFMYHVVMYVICLHTRLYPNTPLCCHITAFRQYW